MGGDEEEVGVDQELQWRGRGKILPYTYSIHLIDNLLRRTPERMSNEPGERLISS